MKKFELELHLLYTPLDAALQLVLAEAKKVPLGQQGPEVIKVFNNSGQHTATLRRIDTREDSLSVENAEPQHKRSQRSQFKPEKCDFVVLDALVGVVWHYAGGNNKGKIGRIVDGKIASDSWQDATSSRQQIELLLKNPNNHYEKFGSVEAAIQWWQRQRLPELVVLNVHLGKMLVAAAGSEYVRSVHLADDPSDYHETYYRREGVLELVQKQPYPFKRFDNEAAARRWWKIDRLEEWVLADRLTGTIWYYPGGEELGKKADVIDLSTWTPVSMKRWEALELLRNGCTKSFKEIGEAVCWIRGR